MVTDIEVAGGSIQKLADTIHYAVSGGVNMVQVRIPDADDYQYREIADTIAVAVNGRATLVANIGRRAIPDTPLSVDGLHFPESEKSRMQEVRHLVANPNTIIGYSAHSPESAAESNQNGADYIILGTVFPSATHPDGSAQGLPLIRSAANRTRTPLIAIGGIDSTNAASAIHAGASGVAVIRSIANARNPQQAASDIRDQIQAAWTERA